jgi:hypothetical protein
VRKAAAAVATALFVASAAGAGSPLVVAQARGAGDPPLLVPWNRIGNIALGGSKMRVEAEYGSAGHGFHVLRRSGNNIQGFYRLHGSRVIVTFSGDKVGELGFVTPYYRTERGFGVGSRIPLGSCHRLANQRCVHLWHGFVFNAWSKGSPCRCWVKVGLGTRSLPATPASFQKPWFFIYTRRGRVTRFYFALKFVD